MARSRNIKPAFFQNEDLVELDYSTRLLFIGLWCLADKAGRLENRPKKIKMQLFPADDLDLPRAILGLAEKKLVTLYVVDSVEYIEVVNFLKHQNPHHKEAQSTIPSPPALGKTGADPSLAVLIPDSLNLIPDSLTKTAQKSTALESDGAKEKAKAKARAKRAAAEEAEANFEIWWKLYPRNAGKQPALKAWLKIKPDFETLMTALKIQVVDDNRYNGGTKVKFISHGSKYLNNALWDDEIELASKPETVYSRPEVYSQSHKLYVHGEKVEEVPGINPYEGM